MFRDDSFEYEGRFLVPCLWQRSRTLRDWGTRGIDITLLANDSLCCSASLQQRRVHYEESCRLDRPADNLRDIPVISRVPDALLSLVLSPTGDRQFGIALMPVACPIGKRTAGFVDWRMTLHVVISPSESKVHVHLRTEYFQLISENSAVKSQNMKSRIFKKKSHLTLKCKKCLHVSISAIFFSLILYSSFLHYNPKIYFQAVFSSIKYKNALS